MKVKRKKPKAAAGRGVKCPKCSGSSAVVYGRHQPDGAYRRRRRCPCGHEFTTLEALPGKNNSLDGIPDYIDGMTLLKAIRATPPRALPSV